MRRGLSALLAAGAVSAIGAGPAIASPLNVGGSGPVSIPVLTQPGQNGPAQPTGNLSRLVR